MTDTQTGWDPQKSKTKANQAAGGAIAGGGLLAAILVFARLVAPEALPWPTEADPVLVTVAAGITGWVRTFWRDKVKHGGGDKKDKTNGGPLSTIGIGGLIVLMMAGAVLSGCQTKVTEYPDGSVTRETVLDGNQALAIVNLILLEGPPAAERLIILAERIQALDDDLETAQTPDEIAELEAQREAIIAALITVFPPEARAGFGADKEQIEALIRLAQGVKNAIK